MPSFALPLPRGNASTAPLGGQRKHCPCGGATHSLRTPCPQREHEPRCGSASVSSLTNSGSVNAMRLHVREAVGRLCVHKARFDIRCADAMML